MCDYYDKSNVIILWEFQSSKYNVPCPIVNDPVMCKFWKYIMDIGLVQVTYFKTRKEKILDLVPCKIVYT